MLHKIAGHGFKRSGCPGADASLNWDSVWIEPAWAWYPSEADIIRNDASPIVAIVLWIVRSYN